MHEEKGSNSTASSTIFGARTGNSELVEYHIECRFTQTPIYIATNGHFLSSEVRVRRNKITALNKYPFCAPYAYPCDLKSRGFPGISISKMGFRFTYCV
eukprot:scaffold7689_cov72-Skeletonema_dohrnii-CCMP3373.AAC.1